MDWQALTKESGGSVSDPLATRVQLGGNLQLLRPKGPPWRSVIN